MKQQPLMVSSCIVRRSMNLISHSADAFDMAVESVALTGGRCALDDETFDNDGSRPKEENPPPLVPDAWMSPVPDNGNDREPRLLFLSGELLNMSSLFNPAESIVVEANPTGSSLDGDNCIKDG